MTFLGDPCPCGWAFDDVMDAEGREVAARVCSRCRRKYVKASWGWNQVTPKNEILQVEACRHNRVVGDACPHCPFGRAVVVDTSTRMKVDAILGEEASFYQYADAIVRAVTRKNVASVMASLPAPFRDKFLGFANQAYIPTEGPRLVIGRPLPDESFEAIRAWWSSTNPTLSRQEEEGGSR